MSNNRVQNALRRGHDDCPPININNVEQDEPLPPDEIQKSLLRGIELLKSENLAVRVRAKQGIIKWMNSNDLEVQAAIEQSSKSIAAELVNIIYSKHYANEMYPPQLLAIEIIGEGRIAAAIPALLDRITVIYPKQIIRDRDRLPPAANALADIGELAVHPILERVANSADDEWKAMCLALHQIDRTSPLVRQSMHTLLDAQRHLPPPATDDEKVRRALFEKRLMAYLKTPEPERPAPNPAPTAVRAETLLSSIKSKE